jgi:LacI family transcriptional regulator
MKQVTLEDIASHLGISKYSVSRALSGKPGVSERTRFSVMNAARGLGYRHPAVLEKDEASDGNIILLIPREDVQDSEFWMDVISGAEKEAEKFNLALITRPFSSNGLAQQLQFRASVRGLIVAGSRARAAMAPYIEAGIPTTLITYPEPLERLDSVTTADCEGGHMVGKYLLDLGHTQLAFVTEAPNKPSYSERFRGFGEAVNTREAARLETMHINPNNPGVSFEEAYRAMLERKQAPTAIFASTDGIAFLVMWALSRLGLSVPRDVSVVGFNDTVQASQFVPKLTTLRIPKHEIGAMAMRYLHQRATGENAALPPRRLLLAPEFVQRESTSPPSGQHATTEGS